MDQRALQTEWPRLSLCKWDGGAQTQHVDHWHTASLPETHTHTHTHTHSHTQCNSLRRPPSRIKSVCKSSCSPRLEKCTMIFYVFKIVPSGDIPGGPVVKTLPSSAVGVGSNPGWGAKIPCASRPKNQNIK